MRILSILGRADRRAFDTVANAQLTGFDHVLPRLSRAADHSILWFAVATGLASTRQTRLRRAALRGVLGIGIASPIVNLVGKRTFRRKRPIIDMVPHIRGRWRIPTSPAFPSGHSASAAAFATGVAMEAPLSVAVPVAAVAGAVAFSRVYNGAHYPGDVLAGMTLGALAGLVTRTIWTTHAAPARIAPAWHNGPRSRWRPHGCCGTASRSRPWSTATGDMCGRRSSVTARTPHAAPRPPGGIGSTTGNSTSG